MVNQKSLFEQFNQPMLAALVGVIASFFKEGVVYAGNIMTLANWDLVRGAASILTHNQLQGWGVLVLGWLVVLFFGAVMGVGIYYSLYWLGKDYLFLKATGIAITVWFINTSILGYALGIPLSAYENFYNYLFYFTGSIVYGLVTTWLFKKLIFNREEEVADKY